MEATWSCRRRRRSSASSAVSSRVDRLTIRWIADSSPRTRSTAAVASAWRCASRSTRAWCRCWYTIPANATPAPRRALARPMTPTTTDDSMHRVLLESPDQDGRNAMSVSAGSLPSFERKAPAACRPALQHPHSSAFADGLQHAGVLKPSVTGQPGQLEIELSGNFSQITAPLRRQPFVKADGCSGFPDVPSTIQDHLARALHKVLKNNSDQWRAVKVGIRRSSGMLRCRAPCPKGHGTAPVRCRGRSRSVRPPS